ncbi:YggT family protein [Hoyosella sp. G463]|uniref:YggT family protein n=1 Tax=Lolliginicoccus lacisalsi TaxID=2742202 RepID=A0A927PN56_9ACTN|nr:YggT family protein [Lolliginicoccus lacisalsi]MBD8507769.1 YggT family protein [Lolliginicoccus lacisalsi]
MVLILDALSTLLFIYSLLLIARVVVEFIRMFARDWRPSGPVVVILEFIFMSTDPPIRFLRRFIPPLTLGSVRLDLSVLILLIGISILRSVITAIRFSAA